MKKHNRNKRSKSSSGLMNSADMALHLVRILTGLVFIFSGFVKAVDPKGTFYKIEDYLTAFGGFFETLTWLAFPAAILLILVELMIGLMLLFMVRIKLSSWLAFVFMLAMTPLTLYLALNNPVTDCGCFGDAIILTNWQTFGKNIIFLLMTIFLLMNQKRFHSIYLIQLEWVLVGIFAGAGLIWQFYNLNHEPVIDFRPYKTGVNISEAMKIPEGAATDSTVSAFIYQKNGEKHTFDISNLPDSTWTFVSQDTKIIRKGYQPPIHDFVILTPDYLDITNEILQYRGKTYLIIIPDLAEASGRGMEKISFFAYGVKGNETKIIGLTASSTDDIQLFKQQYNLNFPFCRMDPVTLKTMMRSNPGVMLLENGIIRGKWHWRDVR